MPPIKFERDWFFPKKEDGNLSFSTQEKRIRQALASKKPGDWIEVNGVICCSREEILRAIALPDAREMTNESKPTHISREENDGGNLEKNKKRKEIIIETIVAVCMFACLSWAIAIDGGRAWERIKQVRTERTNSGTNDALQKSSIKTDDAPHYSSWMECVSIEIVPRAAYGIGQEVTVTNICSHTISKVVVTVTADGRSKETLYFNIAPGKSQTNLITVAADARLYVSDVQVFF